MLLRRRKSEKGGGGGKEKERKKKKKKEKKRKEKRKKGSSLFFGWRVFEAVFLFKKELINKLLIKRIKIILGLILFRSDHF